MNFLGWRKVPIQPEMLGQKALGLHALYLSRAL